MFFNMLSFIWYTFLFQPLFNVLIFFYNGWAHQNLGWAVVCLTIALRLVLLPFSIISEKNAIKEENLEAEAKKMAEAYRGDPVAAKEAYRNFIKKNKISPWAKMVVLLIQILVLFLLYQVFIQGITGERVVKILYPQIDFPGNINVMFYGTDIGIAHNIPWALVCAIYLMVAIFLEHDKKKSWTPAEAVYLFMLPLFTFGALWWLPMVKSIFILTTMMFSTIIEINGKLVRGASKAD